MGATFFSLEVDKTSTSAKFAAGYDLAWWVFHRVLGDFLGTVEPPVAEYISEFASTSGQQRYLQGKRPYNRQRFDYFFPDMAGLCQCAADLTQHWLLLALALWESELDGYFGRNGLGLRTKLPTIKDCLVGEQYIVLREATWRIEADEQGSYLLGRQAHDGPERLPFEAFDHDEQVLIQAASASGRCRCGLCTLLAPDPAGEQRLETLLASTLGYHDIQHAGLWIASLVDPGPALLRRLLAAVPQLTDQPAAYTGQFAANKAFYLLCRRAPATFDTLREGLTSEHAWTRAVAISTIRGALANEHTTYTAIAELLMAALTSSIPEARAVLILLEQIPPPVALHEPLSLRMREAIELFGGTGAPHPASEVSARAYALWKDWFAD